jgi:hypothetical protein
MGCRVTTLCDFTVKKSADAADRRLMGTFKRVSSP